MTNVEINNEIVQLRKRVRRACTCVINKLIREAKALHNKQGTEKQVEKNRKRAAKLLREVCTVRTAKDDEISKFGIANFDRLQEIVQDATTDDRTRAIAKVAKFKPLSAQIAEFREKFPNHRDLLGTKRKKKVLGKQKTGKSAHNPQNGSEPTKKAKVEDVNSVITLGEPTRKSPRACKRRKAETQDSCDSDEDVQSEGENESEEENESKEGNEKTDKSLTNLKKTRGTSNSEKRDVPKPVKVISKQATVKRFTEVLQETNARESEVTNTEDSSCSGTEDTEPPGQAVESGGEVDDFFIGLDGNVKITKTRDPWKGNDADLPKTSGTWRTQSLKKRKDILRDTSGNAGRRKINVAQCKSSNRIRTDGEPRGAKKRKTAAEPKRRSDRQNVENTDAGDSANLHPSWAARKKQQEIMKQGFQGKKIVFDED